MLPNSQDPGEAMLAAICGSGARVRLLRALFASPVEFQSLSGLAKASGADPANTLRALRKLVEAKLLESGDATSGRGYRPRRETALFVHLHSLFSANSPGGAELPLHARLDENKRRIGELLVEEHSLGEIRAKSLENLGRWRSSGVWSGVYDEWLRIVEFGTNADLISAMTSRDEKSNRLRQSMPYVGLLSRDELRSLNEKIAA